MSAIAAIHVAKRDLGIEEDDYRALLERVTGKASLRLMTPGQHGLVLEELRKKGAPRAKSELAGPYAGKLQALWISGWNLGVVRNRSDEALLAFVKGRTGIDHVRFLRDFKDARKAVEALKSWLARDAGVDWAEHVDPQDCVMAAQLRLLGRAAERPGVTVNGAVTPAVIDLAKVATMQLLGEQLRARRGDASA